LEVWKINSDLCGKKNKKRNAKNDTKHIIKILRICSVWWSLGIVELLYYFWLNSTKSRNLTITRHLENVGFFYGCKSKFPLREKTKTMILSTQTTSYISFFPKTVNLFIGNRMGKICRVVKNSRIEATDYQSIKPSCDFRNERVREKKWVFV
jgi:hypothetical protein